MVRQRERSGGREHVVMSQQILQAATCAEIVHVWMKSLLPAFLSFSYDMNIREGSVK
jgi:hypothetical protein